MTVPIRGSIKPTGLHLQKTEMKSRASQAGLPGQAGTSI